jgi:hypothetical protein
VPVCLRFMLRLDRNSFLSFEESTVKLRRPNDPVLRVLRDWRPWASVWWKQVSSDPLCPIYFIIHCPAYYEQPKDWLAFYLPCGLIWLASCYCFTLINEHDEIQWWYYDFVLDMMIYLWHFRGLKSFLECLSVRTCSLDDHSGKVQPWGWYRTPLAN